MRVSSAQHSCSAQLSYAVLQSQEDPKNINMLQKQHALN